MSSSGMLRCVAIVRTDVSEELSVFIIRVTRICELGTTLAITISRCTLNDYYGRSFQLVHQMFVASQFHLFTQSP
jgi:hypothetical protein